MTPVDPTTESSGDSGSLPDSVSGAGQDLHRVYTRGRSIADLARAALQDHSERVKGRRDSSEAGSSAWRSREPKLAEEVLRLHGEPAKQNQVTSVRALHAFEVLQLSEKIADLGKELRDARYDRDRYRMLHEATYDLAVKIAREYADPERIERAVEARLTELRPDEPTP